MFFLCHCERCRKDTGSAHAANLFSSSVRLKWLSGRDKAKVFDFKSEGHIKSFCSKCANKASSPYLLGEQSQLGRCFRKSSQIRPAPEQKGITKALWIMTDLQGKAGVNFHSEDLFEIDRSQHLQI
jgi:hypothetical protein